MNVKWLLFECKCMNVNGYYVKWNNLFFNIILDIIFLNYFF